MDPDEKLKKITSVCAKELNSQLDSLIDATEKIKAFKRSHPRFKDTQARFALHLQDDMFGT